MVFRGKPSKACERCRARRLKCDLHSGTCGQCVRAFAACSGYRDTQQLRVQDETLSVARKATKTVSYLQPQYLPLSIDFQARDAFFAYYIASRCWDFLKPYHHPLDSPEHLTLAIEAVSLAYLWHQVYSDAALAIARKKYILALRMTKKHLGSPSEVHKDTLLMVSLLLDLFEKITNSEPRNKSWTSHINGALALVKLRGIEHFQDPLDFSILVRLSTHYIVGCVSSGSPVSDTFNEVQAYIGERLDLHDPMLRLSNLMIQYANLGSELHRGVLSTNEYTALSSGLDGKIQALDLELPPSWQYSTITLEHDSDKAFNRHFHSYSNPRVCQARNVLRVIRILLNESLLQRHLISPTSSKKSKSIKVAQDNMKTLTEEICACVPQYVDCDHAARHRLPLSEDLKLPDHGVNDMVGGCHRGITHSHTPNHQLSCYTLIFPLYVVGRAKAIPEIKSWAIKQLHHIGSHFRIRNAEVVAQILERRTDVSPWEIYAMLGSYAFAS